jgi:hypothetical protein
MGSGGRWWRQCVEEVAEVRVSSVARGREEETKRWTVSTLGVHARRIRPAQSERGQQVASNGSAESSKYIFLLFSNGPNYEMQFKCLPVVQKYSNFARR